MRKLASIPSDGRLLRTVRRVAEHTRNAKLIATLTPDDEGARFVRPSRHTPAGDERQLRGIPAIGRNVGGAIPGTRPDAIVGSRKQDSDE